MYTIFYSTNECLDQTTTKISHKPIPNNFPLVCIHFCTHTSKSFLIPFIFYLFSDTLIASLKLFSSTFCAFFIVSLFLYRHIINKTRSHFYFLFATICPQPFHNLGIGASTSLAILKGSILDQNKGRDALHSSVAKRRLILIYVARVEHASRNGSGNGGLVETTARATPLGAEHNANPRCIGCIDIILSCAARTQHCFERLVAREDCQILGHSLLSA